MNQARDSPNGFASETLVHYRLLAPEVWTPPRSHKRITADEYVGVYDPRLDLLDELGAIEVTDWGEDA